MIQTMSNPNDWLQFYNQNQSLTTSIPNLTNITTNTVTTATTVTATNTNNSSPPSSTHLNPEGRVTKPTRRRSRASRRTPTTLLNTDTTNFRAMVQQFTGGPTAPFASTPSTTTPQILPNLMGFGFPSRSVPNLNPTNLMISPPPHIYQQQQQQQQQHMFHPNNQQQYNNMYNSGAPSSQGGDNTFFQRLSSSSNNPTNNVDAVLNMDHGSFFPNTSSS